MQVGSYKLLLTFWQKDERFCFQAASRLKALALELSACRLALQVTADAGKLKGGSGPLKGLATSASAVIKPAQEEAPLFHRAPGKRGGIISVAACEAGHFIRVSTGSEQWTSGKRAGCRRRRGCGRGRRRRESWRR